VATLGRAAHTSRRHANASSVFRVRRSHKVAIPNDGVEVDDCIDCALDKCG